MSKIHIKAKSIYPTKDNVMVTEMHFGQRFLKSGIIIPGDDGVERGIRPRWAKVMSVGYKQKDVNPGEWVLVSHGRWTRGIDITDKDSEETITIRMVDPKDILLVSDSEPVDDNTIMQRCDNGN